MITVEEYADWLSNPYVERCLLCVLTCYNLDLEKLTFYVSSRPFQTKLEDRPFAVCFDPRLNGETFFSRSIPFFSKGRGEDNYGGIVIDNTDGALDSWQALQWRGGDILLLLGNAGWSYASFNIKPLFKGIIDSRPSFTNSTIEFSIQDRIGLLDGPVQTKMLTSGQRKDEPVPLCYGYIRNVEPVCTNDALHQYQWNDGAVFQIEQVCDRAVPITGYTTNNNTGTLMLTSRPAGTITLTGKGIIRNGTWLSKPGEIALDIVTNFGPLKTTDIDANSFSDLDEAKPFTLGRAIFERENRLDVLDDILGSVGAYYLFGFDSKFTIGWIKNPNNEPPVMELTENDIDSKGFTVEPFSEFQWRTRLQYQRNHRVQKDGDLAGSISDPAYPNTSRVEWLRNEWRTASYEDDSIIPEQDGQKLYHLVLDPESIPTCIDLEQDAITECIHRQDILGRDVRSLEGNVVLPLFSILPGDIVKVVKNRYGMNNGINVQILGVKYFLLKPLAEIKAFFLPND
jgi:hypothetical protein